MTPPRVPARNALCSDKNAVLRLNAGHLGDQLFFIGIFPWSYSQLPRKVSFSSPRQYQPSRLFIRRSQFARNRARGNSSGAAISHWWLCWGSAGIRSESERARSGEVEWMMPRAC